MNFYLEPIFWPVEFSCSNTTEKISKLGQLSGEPASLPHCGSKLYLWQDIVLQRPSGELAIARVEHFGRPEPRVAQDTHRWQAIRHATVHTHGNHFVGCGDGICVYASS